MNNNEPVVGNIQFNPTYPIYPQQNIPQKQPYCCPVCKGVKVVDGGFYNRTSETWASSGGTEMCRSCNGSGIVWS